MEGILHITTYETFLRLVTITIIAALIGLEREYHRKPAGIRTNVMVGIGSTLMTVASMNTTYLFNGHVAANPTRIAAQIVSGIGFIGAGVILREVTDKGGKRVIGLTTAATLWVVAGMGIAVGMGLYWEAILATAMVFFTFLGLSKLVHRVRQYKKTHPNPNDEDDDSYLE